MPAPASRLWSPLSASMARARCWVTQSTRPCWRSALLGPRPMGSAPRQSTLRAGRSSMASLRAVCIGKAEHIAGYSPLTGINKQARTGLVAIDTMGIAEDAVLDRKHHGGRDQAIYVYFQADYDWWAGELASALEPGLFGENLVIDGPRSADTAIGDRYQIGDCLLEVTYHRTPCMTFAAKMGDKFWVKRFHRANRPG